MCRKMKCCAEVNVGMGKYSCAAEAAALARFVSLPDEGWRGSRIIISGVIISLLGGESTLRSPPPRRGGSGGPRCYGNRRLSGSFATPLLPAVPQAPLENEAPLYLSPA